MKKIILFCLSLVILSACNYDNLEETTPNKPNTLTCDTATLITYTNKIQPILAKYCNNCHSSSSSGGGIFLNTYATAKNAAESGKLYNSVAWSGTASRMPKGGNKISDCDIEIIKKWALNSYAQ